jgi:multicomponent Na+:H+ antiporter subunit C
MLYALCGVALAGIGLWGVVVRRQLLVRLVAFNIVGAGIFLAFGGIAARRADLGADPVPLAMVLTGLVISLAATAVGAALIVRHAALTGRETLPEETTPQEAEDRPPS